MNEFDTRNGAEVVIGSSSMYPSIDNSLASNISTLDNQEGINSTHSIVSSLEGTHLEDVASGIKQRGKMSSIRRFFCCFVLFDLLLISLIWLICIMVRKKLFNFI